MDTCTYIHYTGYEKKRLWLDMEEKCLEILE